VAAPGIIEIPALCSPGRFPGDPVALLIDPAQIESS